jgi:hypothetical protein
MAEVKTELATATKRRQRIKDKFNILRQALGAVEMVLQEMPSFMSSYGLTAPELAVDGLDVNQFFNWLQICLAMLDAGSKLYGNLSAIVAARTLAASVCGLLPTESDTAQTISKT